MEQTKPDFPTSCLLVLLVQAINSE